MLRTACERQRGGGRSSKEEEDHGAGGALQLVMPTPAHDDSRGSVEKLSAGAAFARPANFRCCCTDLDDPQFDDLARCELVARTELAPAVRQVRDCDV